MVISKALKRELISFALTVMAMFATKNIGDLEAVLMLLKKLVEMVEREVNKDVHGFVVSDIVHDDIMHVHSLMTEAVED